MEVEQEPSISTLSGLALARYVLKRLAVEGDSVKSIAEDFDNDEQYILGIVDFLANVRWLRKDENDAYKITKKGQTNTIEREKIVPNFTLHV